MLGSRCIYTLWCCTLRPRRTSFGVQSFDVRAVCLNGIPFIVGLVSRPARAWTLVWHSFERTYAHSSYTSLDVGSKFPSFVSWCLVSLFQVIESIALELDAAMDGVVQGLVKSEVRVTWCMIIWSTSIVVHGTRCMIIWSASKVMYDYMKYK